MNVKVVYTLIRRVKRGNLRASKKLLAMFNPLFLKICAEINKLFKNAVPFEDLYEECQQLFLITTCVDQKKKVPLFAIKTFVYFKLLNYAKTEAQFRNRSLVPNYTAYKEVSPDVICMKKERDQVILLLNNIMWDEFEDYEIDIIIGHYINNVPLQCIARRYGISMSSMYKVKDKCLGRFKTQLEELKIMGMEDV